MSFSEYFQCFEISCSQRKMRQEPVNEPRATVTVSSYVVHFMGLNGIRNYEPTDGNKQCKVVYS